MFASLALLLLVEPALSLVVKPNVPLSSARPAARVASTPCAVLNLPKTEEADKENESGSSVLADTLQALQALRPRMPGGKAAQEGAEDAPAKSTSKLIVVSNRLPFSVKPGAEGYQFIMSSGGLVSAMLGVMDDDAMTWIGWPGVSADTEEERTDIRDQLAEHK